MHGHDFERRDLARVDAHHDARVEVGTGDVQRRLDLVAHRGANRDEVAFVCHRALVNHQPLGNTGPAAGLNVWLRS